MRFFLPLFIILALSQSAAATPKKKSVNPDSLKSKDGKVANAEDCPPEGQPVPSDTITTIEQLDKAIDAIAFTPEFCQAMNSCGYHSENNDCSLARKSFKDVKAIQINNKAGSCRLTNEEMAAISFYSLSGYRCMNEYLWSPSSANDKVQLLINAVNSGLRKLPAYKGLVRRGTTLPAPVKAQHIKGAVVNYQAFTSTSTESGFSETDMFYIFSANGRPIMGFAKLRSEAEVLFPSNTRFKILDVIKKNGKDHYIMKEVTNDSPQNQLAEEKKILALVAQRTMPDFYEPYTSGDMYDCPADPKTKIPESILQKTIPSMSAIKK